MKILKTFLISALLLTSCGPTRFAEDIYENYNPVLEAETLENSITLGAQFLMNHQKPEGNFDYEYNFVTGEYTEDDNQVRQAGALWGLTLIYQEQPGEELLSSIETGLAYFKTHSQTNDAGRYVVYPGEDKGKTGTMALVILSLVDFLRNEDIPNRESYEQDLDEYLNFLLSLRDENGQWSGGYSGETGGPDGKPSPYFDGESLLALIKAAKYAGYENLAADIEDSAEIMYEVNVEEALREDPDSDTTKGFYQWGSMAYYELYTSDWSEEKYASWTIEMAYWMVDVHEVLDRSSNTGYAYEGLISAYELARLTENEAARVKLLYVIDTGLSTITSWQVTDQDTSDPLGIGGVRNRRTGDTLRVDTTQHQMHATILALRYIYSNK